MHRRTIPWMPKRSLAVVTNIDKAICHAQEARVGIVQGTLHLLGSTRFQNARLATVFIAVAAMLKVRNHETGHVRDAGLVCAGRQGGRLSNIVGEWLEDAINL